MSDGRWDVIGLFGEFVSVVGGDRVVGGAGEWRHVVICIVVPEGGPVSVGLKAVLKGVQSAQGGARRKARRTKER